MRAIGDITAHAYVPEQRVYNVTWRDSVLVREGGAQRLGTCPYGIAAAQLALLRQL